MRRMASYVLLFHCAVPYLAHQTRTEMEFVRVQPGEFLMGCSPSDNECDSNEQPSHQVRITQAFEIGKYEVTQGQWQSVMGTDPSMFKGSNLPVENVSWQDAKQFLEKMNDRNDGYQYRLPTEAEWEYAARAGITGAYSGSLDDMGWYEKNSGDQTHPVGQQQPNAWGLYDVHGNVWEWVEDWYGARYYRSSPASNPTGPPAGLFRVARGGSWRDDAAYSRLTFRSVAAPGYAQGTSDVDIGFRCVRQALP